MRRNRLIRHIIFDLDGTLVDSCSTCVNILSEMLRDRNSSNTIDPVVARAYMSRGGLDMVSSLLGSACADPVVDLAEFRARYALHRTASQTLFGGVAQGVKRLNAAGFTLSICSNKPQILCDKVLGDTGISRYFNVVVGSRMGIRPKPARDLLEEVLVELGSAGNDCVFVGDSEIDEAVARAARMRFYFMSYGYADAGWQPAEAVTFHAFDTLTDFFLSYASCMYA